MALTFGAEAAALDIRFWRDTKDIVFMALAGTAKRMGIALSVSAGERGGCA